MTWIAFGAGLIIGANVAIVILGLIVGGRGKR
jgi:hypothetical protein